MRVPRRSTGAAATVALVVALMATACTGASASSATRSVAGTGAWSRSDPPTGSSTKTISSGGVKRTFELDVPPSLPDGTAAPLVVMLHGGYGSGTQAEHSYGWDAAADRHHFVVAYPDGLGRAWDAGGGCCGQPGRDHVDDVAFITAVVADIGGLLPVNPNRIYATGISNGGMMDERLACDTDLFAAIGPDSATRLGPCPHPAPISVIQIHGTADTKVPYLGGQGDGSAAIDGPSVPSVVAGWRTTDGCPAPEATVSGPVSRSVASCPSGRSVELIAIAGAGHQWPGSPLIRYANSCWEPTPPPGPSTPPVPSGRSSPRIRRRPRAEAAGPAPASGHQGSDRREGPPGVVGSRPGR